MYMYEAMIHARMSFCEKSNSHSGVTCVPRSVEFCFPWNGAPSEVYFNSFKYGLERLILQFGISQEDAKKRDTKKIINKISSLMSWMAIDAELYYAKAKRASRRSTTFDLSNAVKLYMTDYEVIMIDSITAQATDAEYCAVISNRIASLFTDPQKNNRDITVTADVLEIQS